MGTLSTAEKIEENSQEWLWQGHRRLARFNKSRLEPGFPDSHRPRDLKEDFEFKALEIRLLEAERALIQRRAMRAPREKNAFLQWFQNLLVDGPGQKSSLHDWLAESADREQMRWFLHQEVAGEAGFEDLTALAQLKMPAGPKLEMARNYWDEMGRGRESGMHGPMLARVAKEFGLASYGREIVIEAQALGNVMLGMAMNRGYAYHAIGALGAIELTAPARAGKVARGLERLGVSREGQRYYKLHAVLDIKHSEEWSAHVLAPLLETGGAEIAGAIAEGAWMRLNAGARCFERYGEYFGFEH